MLNWLQGEIPDVLSRIISQLWLTQTLITAGGGWGGGGYADAPTLAVIPYASAHKAALTVWMLFSK